MGTRFLSLPGSAPPHVRRAVTWSQQRDASEIQSECPGALREGLKTTGVSRPCSGLCDCLPAAPDHRPLGWLSCWGLLPGSPRAETLSVHVCAAGKPQFSLRHPCCSFPASQDGPAGATGSLGYVPLSALVGSLADVLLLSVLDSTGKSRQRRSAQRRAGNKREVRTFSP